MIGAFLTGLYTFRMIFIVFSGEPSAWAREHFHADHGEGPLTMLWVVVLLAIGAVIAGLLQIQGLWELALDFLNPAAEPLVEATGRAGADGERVRRRCRARGDRDRAVLLRPGASALPQVAPLRHVLEHKFYFDEAYHYAFFVPATLLATGLRRFVEGPLIAGSLRGLGLVTREAARASREGQTGIVRTYAFAVASGVAVLILVFVVVR